MQSLSCDIHYGQSSTDEYLWETEICFFVDELRSVNGNNVGIIKATAFLGKPGAHEVTPALYLVKFSL